MGDPVVWKLDDDWEFAKEGCASIFVISVVLIESGGFAAKVITLVFVEIFCTVDKSVLVQGSRGVGIVDVGITISQETWKTSAPEQHDPSSFWQHQDRSPQ